MLANWVFLDDLFFDREIESSFDGLNMGATAALAPDWMSVQSIRNVVFPKFTHEGFPAALMEFLDGELLSFLV